MTHPPINGYTFVRRALFSTSAISKVPILITPAQLKALPKSTTIPLDVSWHMPNSQRSAMAEYLQGPRIPNARRFDLDEVAELSLEKNPLSLTHMLPTGKRFAEECQKLGITNETHVVVYDSIGVFSSPRAAYTFKAFGHDKVSVLDGGLPRWIAEGGETEVGPAAEFGGAEYKAVRAEADPSFVRSYEQIVANADQPSSSAELVLDARALPRFTGEAPEPRPGLSSGHIPNSRPLPFTNLLKPATKEEPYTHYKSPAELKEVFKASAGEQGKVWSEIEGGQKGLVFSCGSGMTAAIGWLATRIVAEDEDKTPVAAAIYDESWTGYASRPESKIVKGKVE